MYVSEFAKFRNPFSDLFRGEPILANRSNQRQKLGKKRFFSGKFGSVFDKKREARLKL